MKKKMHWEKKTRLGRFCFLKIFYPQFLKPRFSVGFSPKQLYSFDHFMKAVIFQRCLGKCDTNSPLVQCKTHCKRIWKTSSGQKPTNNTKQHSAGGL